MKKTYEYQALVSVSAEDEDASLAKLDELITLVVKGDLQIGVVIDSEHPRVTGITAEIGTTGEEETIELHGFRESVTEAVELEHPCADESCDITQALEDGYPLWAAELLRGATETPLLDAVLNHYSDRYDFEAQAEAERVAWLSTRASS